MQSNLTLQVTFADVTKPTLTISAPTANQRWSNSVYNVTGTASGWAAWSPQQAAMARTRYEFHQFRQQREAAENDSRLEQKAQTRLADLAQHSQHTDPEILDKKREVIEAALARARLKRESGNSAA